MVRLDPSDAMYVDIIHTDSRPFIKGGELGTMSNITVCIIVKICCKLTFELSLLDAGLGMSAPIGHLDFYPNGGENQPGCNQGMMKYINRENGSFYQGMRRFLACDHVRAHEYFNESVNTVCNFVAIECDSYDEFLNGDCFSCLSDTVCI